MKHVVILTEGGTRTGFGHVARCKAIAAALSERSVTCEFLISGDENVKRVLEDSHWQVIDWQDGDYSSLKSYLKKADLVFVDSYTVSQEKLSQIQLDSCRMAVIDESGSTLKKGILVCPTIYSDSLTFPNSPDLHIIAGSQYIPLREPFWNSAPKDIADQISQIFMSLGGIPQPEVLRKLLSTILDLMPTCSISVVSGDLEELRDLQRENQVKFVTAPEGEELISIMKQSDLAITGGGQTLYETLALGIPTISLLLAENQRKPLVELRNKGAILDFSVVNQPEWEIHFQDTLQAIQAPTVRVRQSQRGQSLIDGKGASRIAEELSLLCYGAAA